MRRFEIYLAQVEWLIDYEYNENAKLNRVRIQLEGNFWLKNIKIVLMLQ